MPRIRRSFASLLFVTAAFSAAATAQTDASRLPIEVFMRNPDIQEAKLSPSGRYIAITSANKQNRLYLAVIDLSDSKLSGKAVASYTDTDVRSFEWVNDERLVFNIIDFDSPVFRQGFGPGLFAVRRDGGPVRSLIKTKYNPITDGAPVNGLEPNHALLETLRDGSDDVIVGEYRFRPTGELDGIYAKRLNTTNGRLTSLSFGAPPNAQKWVFDHQGNARAVYTEFEGRQGLFWRDPGKTEWTQILSEKGPTASVRPLAVDAQGAFYVSAVQKGTEVFKRFDLQKGAPEADAIVSATGFDVDPSPIFDTEKKVILGVNYRTDAAATVWFDPSMKALQDEADKAFPGHVNVLTCRRCTSDGVLLVDSYSDQDPGGFYMYRASTKAWELIGKRRPKIDPRLMAQLDLNRIKARDGEDLPVWVTTPPSKSAGPRPAIVLVHGGPWLRGTEWKWNPDAQFLASRGYLVIEPEYRGSTGYGDRHFRNGFKQWGLKMQDDVADAVQWAEAKGLADPKRVCIMGASYGGYATLMGLVRQPDLYRCGVAWVAVTDPRFLYEDSALSDISREAQEFGLPEMVGDLETDKAMLKDAAPVEHAKDIKAPLLMAFGGSDVRVPLAHGRAMRSALGAAGREPEYVVYDGEGHGFLKLDNRVDFYTRVERFLAKNLQ